MRLLETLDILAGGPGSGCDPEAARKEGNVCGRPPEGATSTSGIKLETRPQHTIGEIQKAISGEPKKSELGYKFEKSKDKTYSVISSDTAKTVIKEGAIIIGQIALFVALDRFMIAPAIKLISKGGPALWRYAKMAKLGSKAKKLTKVFAASEGAVSKDDYAVIVWRPGLSFAKSGKEGVGWRDVSVKPELVDSIEFYRNGETEPYKIIKNEIKK
jgi:hypothetical protein